MKGCCTSICSYDKHMWLVDQMGVDQMGVDQLGGYRILLRNGIT